MYNIVYEKSVNKMLKGLDDGVVKRDCTDCVRDAALLLEKELQ